MRSVTLLLLLLVTAIGEAAPVDCNSFCVTNIQLNLASANLDVTVFLEGDSTLFINYPYVTAVTDSNGDTLATGNMNFFGQFGSTSQTYAASTTLNSLPANFTATVYFQYDTLVCALPYPCPDTCSFTPTVSGDFILCPDEQGLLSTQVYDSYQWYKRDFFGTARPISGATSQTLDIDQFNDAGYYFFVEATDSGCTEMSAEVLVDGYAFLSPFVETTGDYTTGNNGETIICADDTAYFTLMLPYDTLITWYKDSNPLAETSNVLTVTNSGLYTVQGAPSICPGFIQQLGVTLEVQAIIDCETGMNTPGENSLNCYWSFPEKAIYIKNIPAGVTSLQAAVYTAEGKSLRQEIISAESAIARLSITALPRGSYICLLRYDDKVVAKKLVVTE